MNACGHVKHASHHLTTGGCLVSVFPPSSGHLDAPSPSESDGIYSVKGSVKTSVKILQLLAENPRMSLAEVAATVDRSLRAVELASAKLIKAGRLQHVGPANGGHWEVLQ